MLYNNVFPKLGCAAAALAAIPFLGFADHPSHTVAPAAAAPDFTVHVLGAECFGLRYASCRTTTACSLAVQCWIAGTAQKDPDDCTEFPCKAGSACQIPDGCNSVYTDPVDCLGS